LDWLSNLQSIVYILVMVLGLLVHYWKSEGRNEERHKQVRGTLDDHESRLRTVEGGDMQDNGQTKYIPRAECRREMKKHEKDIEYLKSTQQTYQQVVEKSA